MSFTIGVLFIIFADQASKIWIAGHMELGESIPVINKIVHITYIQNPSSAFGLLPFSNRTFIIMNITIILLGVIFWLKKARQNRSLFFPSILILGGALGNLIDRIRVGSVIDFLDLRVWPIFNIADSAMNIGIFILIIHCLFQQEGKKEDKKLEGDNNL